MSSSSSLCGRLLGLLLFPNLQKSKSVHWHWQHTTGTSVPCCRIQVFDNPLPATTFVPLRCSLATLARCFTGTRLDASVIQGPKLGLESIRKRPQTGEATESPQSHELVVLKFTSHMAHRQQDATQVPGRVPLRHPYLAFSISTTPAQPFAGKHLLATICWQSSTTQQGLHKHGMPLHFSLAAFKLW